MTTDEWPPLRLQEHLGIAFDRVYHWFDWRIRGARCLLTHHDVCWGSYMTGEPDWCRRCWRDDPNEERTLWSQVHYLFVFLVEHSKLFERFDIWIIDSKLSRWLPSWWEY